MASEQDWDNYRTAVVDLSPADGAPIRIIPDRPGAAGVWPEGLVPPVFVITAWNPDSMLLDRADNRNRQAALVAELDRRGVAHWPSVGRDLGTPHFEEGAALVGLSEAEALSIGSTWGQAAVYRWTPDAWEVVSCTDDRRLSSGWRTESRPAAGLDP